MKRIYLYIVLLLAIFLFSNCSNGKEKRREYLERNQTVYYNANPIKDSLARKIFLEGIYYTDYGDYEKARALFLRANDMEPNNSTILVALGGSIGSIDFINKKPLKDCYPYFEQAIKIDSLKARNYFNFGRILTLDKNFAYSELILRLGLKKSNANKREFQSLYLNLASNYYSQGLNAEALQTLDSASTYIGDEKTNIRINGFRLQIKSEIINSTHK